jgi:signal transduction histidine kinase
VNVIRRLRLQFIAVFMALMLFLTVAISAGVYCQRKAELEYQCMVYLLDIHNFENRETTPVSFVTATPPGFVLEIDNQTNTAQVVYGDFFLADQGITPEELIGHLLGTFEESGVLADYGVRYFNGVRQEHAHRVSFIDVTYIREQLNQLLTQIVLFALPSLGVLFCAALLLSRWFVQTAQKAMDEQRQFIAKVSHELKTPVAIVQANVDLIDRSSGGDERDFCFGCENIRQECRRMNELVEAMLWTALPTQHAQKKTTVDFTRLLQGETLRFEVMAFDRGLTLTLEAAEGLTLSGEEVSLTRLVDILLENAIKYCAPGGVIQVEAGHRSGLGRKLRFSCASTGQELTREQRENIFKPFYQVDGTCPGAGLGLSMAQEMVCAMHGAISYRYAQGQNCFVVEL